MNDPHLLSVLLTRARNHMQIVHSALPPPGTLFADYLAQADTPPGPPPPVGDVDAWTTTIADHLNAAGIQLRTSYPVGRHILPLCTTAGLNPVVIETAVHPDGPDAHIDRRLDLTHTGWRFLEAYPSKWADRPGEITIELLNELRPNTT